ncbi:hypothetical protein FRC06_003432 [Ceratobasidium sp. 370]|nr:hypothetical protein FRC06_003432 [Ceratobasidium sp. 370]
MATLSGQYDLVSWDPRGVGLSERQPGCPTTPTEENAFWNGSIARAGIEARGDFTDQADLDAFYAQGPDKQVNFWGVSYGTIYFVNMFPDRVGRVVLDRVSDRLYRANNPPHEKWAINVESTDEALTGFVSAGAAAGPGNCALAKSISTAENLREDVCPLIDLAHEFRKKYGPTASISSADLRATRLNTIREALTNTTSTPSKRSFDLTLLPENTKRQSSPEASGPPFNYDIHTITCADAVDPGNTTTQMVFDEVVRAGFVCHKWPVRAVERYTGPWNKKLTNPILVIGNEADPITPFKNAKRVADALGESAVLIEQDDYGVSVTPIFPKNKPSYPRPTNSAEQVPNLVQLLNSGLTRDHFQTNQVLFPGPGITKGCLSALSGSGSGNLATSNSGDLEADLEAARAYGTQLFTAVIVLVCSTGLLLLCLVGSSTPGRKKRDAQEWTHVTREMFKTAHEEQGHVYTTPYDPAEVKRVGGYASVETRQNIRKM